MLYGIDFHRLSSIFVFLQLNYKIKVNGFVQFNFDIDLDVYVFHFW